MTGIESLARHTESSRGAKSLIRNAQRPTAQDSILESLKETKILITSYLK